MVYSVDMIDASSIEQTRPLLNPLFGVYQDTLLKIMPTDSAAHTQLLQMSANTTRAFNAKTSELEQGPNLFRFKNVTQKMIASAMTHFLAYQQLGYLQDHHLTTSDTSAEHMLAGLLKRRSSYTGTDGSSVRVNGAVRKSVSYEELNTLLETNDPNQLTELYLTKCGDFLRAVFDGNSPNGPSAGGNLEAEAQTLAVLQLALEGNQQVVASLRKRNMTWEPGRNIVRTIPQDIKSQIMFKTGEVFKDNLWLVNTVTAICGADPNASDYFTTMRGEDIKNSFNRVFTPYNIQLHHSGFFRSIGSGSDFSQVEKWTPFVAEVKKLFLPAKPIPASR